MAIQAGTAGRPVPRTSMLQQSGRLPTGGSLNPRGKQPAYPPTKLPGYSQGMQQPRPVTNPLVPGRGQPGMMGPRSPRPPSTGQQLTPDMLRQMAARRLGGR
jgi:hypothetical protein